MLGLGAFMELPFATLNDVTIDVASSEAVVAINGVTMSSLGLKIERVDGWHGAPPRQWQTIFVPGRAGLTKAATVVQEASVELRLVGTLRASTNALLRTAFDTLASVLSESPLTVICPDDVTRAMQGELMTIDVEPFGPQFTAVDMPITIALTCQKPYKYEIVDTVTRGVAATTLRLPLGNAIVRPRITVYGPATNPTLTLSDYAGTTTLATMTYTGTLVDGDSLVFDCDLMTVRKNGVSAIASFSGTFFRIDPSTAAQYRAASWPRLVCSSGDVEARYARTWLL